MAYPDPGNLSYSPYPAGSGGGKGGGGGISGASRGAAFGILKKLAGMNKGNELTVGTGLDASGEDQGPSVADQVLALKMQALDAKYGADSAGGGGAGPSLKGYGGPSIEALRQYGATGAGDIQKSYADLQGYLTNSGNASQLYLQDAKNKEAAGYAKAGADIATGRAAPGTAMFDSSDATSAAAKEQNAAVQKIYQHYADLNAQHSTVAQQAIDAMAAGQKNIATEIVAGKGRQGNEQLYRFNTSVNQKIAQAQQQMDAIAAENSRRMANYNASQGSKASKAEGNKEAAKLNLLAQYVKDQEGGHLTGAQGVLHRAMQAGNPEAGNAFLAMVAGARGEVNRINQAAIADKSGLTKKTNEKEQLFLKLAQGVPDINDPNSIAAAIQSHPELQRLSKYSLQSPNQVTSNLDVWEQVNPGIKAALAREIQGGSRLGMSQDQILGKVRDKYAQEFKPSFNMTGLKAAPDDYRLWQDWLQQQTRNNQLNQELYEIYSGKWGSG